MKFVILSLALVACVLADVSELGYSYGAPSAPASSYVAPAASAAVNSFIAPAASAPANSYVPPAAGAVAASAPVEVATDFGDDGYRYKTVRRRVIRRRI